MPLEVISAFLEVCVYMEKEYFVLGFVKLKIYYQLDKISNHLRDKSLGVSAREFID